MLAALHMPRGAGRWASLSYIKFQVTQEIGPSLLDLGNSQPSESLSA
jgi:hypothetical protein